MYDKYGDKWETSSNENLFIKYDVPMKNNLNYPSWAMNWPGNLTPYDENGKARPIRLEILYQFSQRPASKAAEVKYRNTIAFVDYALAIKQLAKPIELDR